MLTIRPSVRRTGATAATVLVLGAAAFALSGCSSNSASPAGNPSSPAPASPGAGHHRHGVRGTVSAETPTSWTVTTAQHKTVTVTITPQTQFGSKKAPATAATFPVGSQVMIMGQQNGDTVTATRIRAAGQHKGGGANATGAPAPTQ
jgi:hypothetical protein